MDEKNLREGLDYVKTVLREMHTDAEEPRIHCTWMLRVSKIYES
jgi:hypothetical protein